MKNIIFLLLILLNLHPQLFSQTASISGSILMATDDPVEKAVVSLFDDQGNLLASQDLQNSSTFTFADLPTSVSYTISVSKDINPLNGVSTFDLVRGAKHLLAIEPLDNPYQILAADVNFSGTVTTYDLLLIRRLILAIDQQFSVLPSWRFIPADTNFADPENPGQGLPNVGSITVQLEADLTDLNFIGIKLGDMNYSAFSEN